jgi:threonine dehydrogenase-like Zn-dependent dehydrogenase
MNIGEVSERDTEVIWCLVPSLCSTLGTDHAAKQVIGIDSVPERLALARNVFKIEVLVRLALSFSDVTVTDKLLEFTHFVIIADLISALVDVIIFVVPPPTDEDL